MDDHLVAWETEPIDVSDLAPGTYIVRGQRPRAAGRSPTRGRSSSSRSADQHARTLRMDTMKRSLALVAAALLLTAGCGDEEPTAEDPGHVAVLE